MNDIELQKHPETGELVPEVWKSIEGYEGLYQISNYGRVRSWKTTRRGKRKTPLILKPSFSGYGYGHISLCKDKPKSHNIHNLVAKEFVPNPNNKPCVNHLDGDKENNFYLNLEWCTYSENHKHAFKIGLKNATGENSNRSKLTKKQVIEIRKLYKTNKYTQKELGKKFNVGRGCINSIVNRVNWTHI